MSHIGGRKKIDFLGDMSLIGEGKVDPLPLKKSFRQNVKKTQHALKNLFY